MNQIKKLKNTGSIERHPLDKLDAKRKNRKERHSEKRQIQEGIEEYNTRYDKYTCSNCEHNVEGYCIDKKEWVYDQEICKDFRD